MLKSIAIFKKYDYSQEVDACLNGVMQAQGTEFALVVEGITRFDTRNVPIPPLYAPFLV